MERARFEQLALEQLDPLFRFARSLARDDDEAGDLVQETYRKAIEAAGSFEPVGGGMRPWLFRILQNVFYTRRRIDTRRGPEARLGEVADDRPPPDQPRPALDLRTFDWEHVDEEIKRAVDRLPPEQRSVLLLWGVEGLKYREIAAIQDVPVGTVMSRLHRARAAVLDHLALAGEHSDHARRSSFDDAAIDPTSNGTLRRPSPPTPDLAP